MAPARCKGFINLAKLMHAYWCLHVGENRLRKDEDSSEVLQVSPWCILSSYLRFFVELLWLLAELPRSTPIISVANIAHLYIYTQVSTSFIWSTETFLSFGMVCIFHFRSLAVWMHTKSLAYFPQCRSYWRGDNELHSMNITLHRRGHLHMCTHIVPMPLTVLWKDQVSLETGGELHKWHY